MVEVSEYGRMRAGAEKGRVCVRDVCEDDRESVSAAGGDTSVAIGSA